jgi:hypothetical protein
MPVEGHRQRVGLLFRHRILATTDWRADRYAADNGAKSSNEHRPHRDRTARPSRRDQIRRGQGCLLAIAAGNDFEDGNPKKSSPKSPRGAGRGVRGGGRPQ